MDILPKLLGEKEFRYFTAEDYAALASVLDEVTAKYIRTYCDKSDADPELVNSINTYLQSTLTALTFHLELKESGIVDLVQSLSPESLEYADVNLDELISKLSYLEEHQDDIKATIPGRTSKDFEKFAAHMSAVVGRMITSGVEPTYPDISRRIQANKFLFYQTGEKEHTTGVGILNSRKRQWTLTLNGAKWLKYCWEKELTYDVRNAF